MPDRFGAVLARTRVPLGFALAIVYFVFSRPTAELLAGGAAVAAVGMALRAVATGYLEKDRRLATAGPYAYTRNPLYLGSAIIAAGFALSSGVAWLAALLAAYFVGVYWPVVKWEELRLRELFPQEYPAYAAAVPLFFPRWRRGQTNEPGYRAELYWTNREYRALVGYAAALLLLILKMQLIR